MTAQAVEEAIAAMLAPGFDPQWAATFLTDLAARGETAAEITAAARVMRSLMQPVKAPEGVIDVCGTGGDGLHTLNISTAVALVVAACGVPVAKHGNRAVSSKSGAADVLEQLGVNLDAGTQKLEQALAQVHFAFLMAPRHHPAMKNIAPVRKSLGRRTVFNLLGPLCNPAQVKCQLLGVSIPEKVPVMAQVLRDLGHTRALVVCGVDGMDEIGLNGPAIAAELKDGEIVQGIINPADFGLGEIDLGAIKGGDAAFNAAAMLALLQGTRGAYHDVVCANAAAALYTAGACDGFEAGCIRARQVLSNGEAFAVLENYKRLTQ